MGSNYTTYTYELCLEDGEYIVWGKDSYGDGWNVGGNYVLTDEEGTVITSGYGPSSGTAWEALGTMREVCPPSLILPFPPHISFLAADSFAHNARHWGLYTSSMHLRLLSCF